MSPLSLPSLPCHLSIRQESFLIYQYKNAATIKLTDINKLRTLSCDGSSSKGFEGFERIELRGIRGYEGMCEQGSSEGSRVRGRYVTSRRRRVGDDK